MPLLIENSSRIEPCLLESIPIGIADVIADLITSSERLASRLHPNTASSLADMVRMMNCYYSNLIEGHNTKPRDIERALVNDLEKDELRRNFQIEARAHVGLQSLIDKLYAKEIYQNPHQLILYVGCTGSFTVMRQNQCFGLSKERVDLEWSLGYFVPAPSRMFL